MKCFAYILSAQLKPAEGEKIYKGNKTQLQTLLHLKYISRNTLFVFVFYYFFYVLTVLLSFLFVENVPLNEMASVVVKWVTSEQF